MAQLFFRLSNIFKENGKEAMMSKNKLITSLIIGAILFSSLAAFLIYHYMAPARSTIYMFNDSYSSGEQVTSDMLTPVQVDSQIVMAGKTTGRKLRFRNTIRIPGYNQIWRFFKNGRNGRNAADHRNAFCFRRFKS